MESMIRRKSPNNNGLSNMDGLWDGHGDGLFNGDGVRLDHRHCIRLGDGHRDGMRHGHRHRVVDGKGDVLVVGHGHGLRHGVRHGPVDGHGDRLRHGVRDMPLDGVRHGVGDGHREAVRHGDVPGQEVEAAAGQEVTSQVASGCDQGSQVRSSEVSRAVDTARNSSLLFASFP